MASNLPAWDDIVTADSWQQLKPEDRQKVYKQYLGDIGQTESWKGLSQDDKLKVTRRMEIDAGFYQPPPTAGEKLGEVAEETTQKITAAGKKVAGALKAPFTTKRDPFADIQPQERRLPTHLDAPKVGDSYFLHSKRVIGDEFGGSQEVGPGFVTPWSKLSAEDRTEDVMQVVEGKRKDFGEISRYVNQLYREYGDYGQAAEELKNMIDKGILPNFYMTVSDTPYEEQYKNYKQFIEKDRPDWDALGLPVGEPEVGGKFLQALFIPFAPAEALYTGPGAFTEADLAGGDLDAIERAEASLEDIAGLAGEQAAKLFPGGYSPEAPWQEYDLSPELAAMLAKEAGRYGIAYPFYARLVAANLWGVYNAARLSTARFTYSRAYANYDDARRAYRGFTVDNAQKFAMEEMMRTDPMGEGQAAGAAFERKYGFRSPHDPRGEAPEIFTEPRVDPATGETEIRRIPQMSLGEEDLPMVRSMYQNGEINADTVQAFKSQNPKLALELDDIINEKIIDDIASTGEVTQEAMSDASRTGEGAIPRGEEITEEAQVTPEERGIEEGGPPAVRVRDYEAPGVEEGAEAPPEITERPRLEPTALQSFPNMNEVDGGGYAVTSFAPHEIQSFHDAGIIYTNDKGHRVVDAEALWQARQEFQKLPMEEQNRLVQESNEKMFKPQPSAAKKELAPAIKEVQDAFQGIGRERLEKAGIMQPGESLADFFDRFFSRTKKDVWAGGKKFRATAIEELSKKNLWGNTPEAERLRKAMLGLLKQSKKTAWNPEWLPEEPEYTGPERRVDLAKRKRVAEMTPEEMQRELLTDPITNLKNRRAYDEAEKMPTQVAVDVDSLKWVNDNMGHEAGDELIKEVGRALNEATEESYRTGGDEFVVQANSPEEAEKIMARAQEILESSEVVAVLPDGTEVSYLGLNITHGSGKTLGEADAKLRSEKASREKAGLRAPRGGEPPGVVKKAPERLEVKGAEEISAPFKPVQHYEELNDQLIERYTGILDRLHSESPNILPRELLDELKKDIGDKYGYYSVHDVYDRMADLVSQHGLGEDIERQVEALYKEAADLRPDIELYPVARIGIHIDNWVGRGEDPPVAMHEDEDPDWYWSITPDDPWLASDSMIESGGDTFIAQDPRKEYIPSYTTRGGKQVKQKTIEVQDFVNLRTGEKVTLNAEQVWERMRSREEKEPLGEQLELEVAPGEIPDTVPADLVPLAERLAEIDADKGTKDMTEQQLSMAKTNLAIQAAKKHFGIEGPAAAKQIKEALAKQGFTGKAPLADLRKLYQRQKPAAPPAEEKALTPAQRRESPEYKEGYEAAIKFDSDTTKGKNPYPKGSEKWQSWNAGWNAYDQPTEVRILDDTVKSGGVWEVTLAPTDIDLAELNKAKASSSEVLKKGDKWIGILTTVNPTLRISTPPLDSADDAKAEVHKLWMGVGGFRTPELAGGFEVGDRVTYDAYPDQEFEVVRDVPGAEGVVKVQVVGGKRQYNAHHSHLTKVGEEPEGKAPAIIRGIPDDFAHVEDRELYDRREQSIIRSFGQGFDQRHLEIAKISSHMMEDPRFAEAAVRHPVVAERLLEKHEPGSLDETLQKAFKESLVEYPPARIEFEHATFYGTVGDAWDARGWWKKGKGNKTGWGDFIAVHPLMPDDPLDPVYTTYVLKDTSPQTVRWTTRNALKELLPKGYVKLVGYAVSEPWETGKPNKIAFTDSLKNRKLFPDRDPAEVIRESTGLDPKDFWRAAKNGDIELVRQLFESGRLKMPKKTPKSGPRARLFGYIQRNFIDMPTAEPAAAEAPEPAKPTAWKPETRPQKERIEWSFNYERKDLMRDRDYPKLKEREDLGIGKDYTHIYHSPNRPLSYLLVQRDLPEVKLSESGRYLFSKDPIPMEQIYRWELGAISNEAKGELALEYYRAAYPKAKGVEFLKEIDKERWQGAVISESSKEPGRYQLTWFDQNGFIGDTSFPTEAAAVAEAITDGYNTPMPGLLDEAAAKPEFLEGIQKVEEAQKAHRERMQAAYEDRPTIFSSGASRISDLRTMKHAGEPVGVSVSELTGPATESLIDYGKNGGQIFMDSGAYQGADVDWGKTFDTYAKVTKESVKAPKVVAPDVIGEQEASLALLRKHKDKIGELIDMGADVIVPLQLRENEGSEPGRFGPVEIMDEVVDILGTDDFTMGIPSVPGKPAAWTDAEIKDLLDNGNPSNAIHFLGVGETDLPRINLARPYFESNDYISMDSTFLRKDMATIAKRRAKIEAEIPEGEKLPGYAREEAAHTILHPHLLGRDDIGLALVSCGAEKGTEAAEAKDLYQGDLFKKSRDFAELKGRDWMILSAKHGLLRPTKEIEPYDVSMKDLSPEEQKKWADRVVANIKLIKPVKGFTRITVLAGEDYRKFLVPLLEEAGYDVFVPMEGMGIGKQKSWLKRAVEKTPPEWTGRIIWEPDYAEANVSEPIIEDAIKAFRKDSKERARLTISEFWVLNEATIKNWPDYLQQRLIDKWNKITGQDLDLSAIETGPETNQWGEPWQQYRDEIGELMETPGGPPAPRPRPENVERIEFKGWIDKEGKKVDHWVPVEVNSAKGTARFKETPSTHPKPIMLGSDITNLIAADNALSEGIYKRFSEVDEKTGYREFDYDSFLDILQKEGIQYRIVPTKQTVTPRLQDKITALEDKLHEIRDFQLRNPKNRTMTLHGEKFTIVDELKRIFTSLEDLQKGIDPDLAAKMPGAPDIDAFRDRLDKYGVAVYGGVHYKVVPAPKEGFFAVERTVEGARDTFVTDSYGKEFMTMEHAKAWAIDNAKTFAARRAGLPEEWEEEPGARGAPEEVEEAAKPAARIPEFERKRKTFPPGTKERAKLIDEPFERLQAEYDALDSKVVAKQGVINKTRRNAHKKLAALRGELRELERQRYEVSKKLDPLRERHYLAMLEDAAENPRDEAQRLAVQYKLLDMDDALNPDTTAEYHKGIQDLARKEAKRQGANPDDIPAIAVEYTNDVLSYPLSDTYEIKDRVKVIAAKLEHTRWAGAAENEIEALEMPNHDKNRFFNEIRNLSVWDQEKVPQILARARETNKDYLKKEAIDKAHEQAVAEAKEKINLETTIEGDTLAAQKANLDKFLDGRIKLRRKIEKAEGYDTTIPAGRIIINLGPTKLTVWDEVESLVALRKQTGKLTRTYITHPKKYAAPPRAPKQPLQALARQKISDLVRITDKPPAGQPTLWTNGHMMDTGQPPKGSGYGERTIDYRQSKDVWDLARKVINDNNQVVGDFQFSITEEGKPDEGILTNRQGQVVGVNPFYVAYFRNKYPNANFYFELGTKDTGGMIAVADKGEMVGMFMSVAEPIDLEGKEMGKVPLEVSPKKNYGGPSGRGYASVGEYATAGEYAAPLAQIMQLPEIVQLAKALNEGKYPRVRRKLRMMMASGVFHYSGPTSYIELLAAIFEDPAQAAAVLAHEVGHLVDWLPDKTLKRGNILGRIASLKKHLKHTMPRAPGAQEELTEEDRRRLRYQAEKMIKEENADKWIDEVIREELPIEPDDVLAIWNDVEGKVDPELLNFIKSLTTPEIKAIVKDALKGITHESLAQFAKVVETPTGEKIQVDIYEEYTDKHGLTKKRLKPEYREKVAERYADLIKEEIKKLRLFHVTEIMDELKALSRAWKPFDPAFNAKYTKYRYSSPELYADAISALINAPGLLKSMAPNFYEGFFNYLDAKPEVKRLYNEIQDIIRQGLADDEIIKVLYENQRKGSDISMKAIEDARKKDPRLEAFLRDFYDAHWTLIKHVRAAGESQIPPGENPRYKMEDLIYSGSEVEWMLTQVKANILKPLEEVGLTWDDFGVVRKLKRIAGEAEAPKAGEEGIFPERAQKMLDNMRRNRDPEQNRAMRQANKAFEDLGRYIIEKGKEAQYWDPELIEVMEDNVEYYSTIDVLRHYEKRFGKPVAAKIFPRIGTLESARNPATATLEKYIAMIKAINRKIAAETLDKFLWDFRRGKFGPMPEEFTKRPVIRDADRKWNGRFMEIKNPRSGSDEGLIAYLHNGKAKGIYVHKWLADMFEENPYEQMLISKILRSLANPMRFIFTEANPGFMLFNLARDYQDTIKKLPGAKMATFWLQYLKAVKPAARSIFGIPDDVAAELQKGKALISVANYRGLKDIDTEIERLLARYKLEPSKYRVEFLKPFVDLMVWVTNIGRVIERVPKIAGYQHLKKLFPEMPEPLLMHMVRTRAGSPAFLRKGRASPIYNNFLIYSNAAKEGPRAQVEAALDNPLEYLWKQTKYTFIPKLLMIAGAMGALGIGVKSIYDRASDFDMTNYYVLPLGLTPQGKAVYLRIPQDEFSRLLGGIMWKIWKHDEPKYWTNLADYMAGQAPTLNPVIESAFDAALYAMGKNPYDAFRGKYALPEQLFKARDKRTHKAFMKYLANQLGASIIYRFQTDDLDRIKTDLEKDLQYPIVSNILGRFLKVSDQGERQAYRADKDLIDMTQAREILDAKEVIIKMVNGEPVSHEDIMKLAKRPSVVDRNLLVQMSRRYGYVFLDEYLTATTREAQFAVIKRWYDRYRLENPGEDITWIWGVPEVVMKSPPPRKESVESTKEPSAKKSLEEYSSQYYKRRRPGVSRQQQQANPFLGGTQ